MPISNSDVIKIIDSIYHMTPADPTKSLSEIENCCNRLTRLFVGLGGIMFAFLCVMLAWHTFFTPLTTCSKLLAMCFAIGAMIFPVAGMITSIISGIWLLVNSKNESLRHFVIEIQNDHDHVERLMSNTKQGLEDAQKLIQLKMCRIQRRLGMFIGGPERIALFSIVATGWIAYRELSGNSGLKITAGLLWANGDVIAGIVQFGFAFLAGIALGAVILNVQHQRYAYQFELLELAISKKSRSAEKG